MCRQKDAKTVQGCALKTRSPCCAGYEFIFRLPPKNKSVLHADGLKKSLRRILSPLRWSAERRTTTPVPSSKEGDYGGRNEIFSNLRLARCKAADPWLWLAGLSVCRKMEGVPLPRSGGGWEGANVSQTPFKPICVQYEFGCFVTEKSKSVSSAAGRPGFQGAALNDFWLLFFTEK